MPRNTNSLDPKFQWEAQGIRWGTPTGSNTPPPPAPSPTPPKRQLLLSRFMETILWPSRTAVQPPPPPPPPPVPTVYAATTGGPAGGSPNQSFTHMPFYIPTYTRLTASKTVKAPLFSTKRQAFVRRRVR